jgi:hypothetical protein
MSAAGGRSPIGASPREARNDDAARETIVNQLQKLAPLRCEPEAGLHACLKSRWRRSEQR